MSAIVNNKNQGNSLPYIINCFGQIINSNEKLIKYIDEINDLKKEHLYNQLIVNIFNQPKIIGALKKKGEWKKITRVFTSCLKIGITIAASVLDITHIFRTIPNLIKEFNNDILSHLHESVEGYQDTVEDIETMSRLSYKNGTINIKQIFIKILIDLSNYDLSFEIYRSNIIYIKNIYKSDKQGETDIILELLELSKHEMFIAFKSFLKSIPLKNSFTKVEFDNIFENDSVPANNQLSKNFNNFLKKIDDIISKSLVKEDNKPIYKESINLLYSIFENSEKIFKQLNKSFIKLNSYITRMNILLTIPTECKGTNLKIHDSYNICSIIIHKLVENCSQPSSTKEIITDLKEKTEKDANGKYEISSELQRKLIKDTENIPETSFSKKYARYFITLLQNIKKKNCPPKFYDEKIGNNIEVTPTGPQVNFCNNFKDPTNQSDEYTIFVQDLDDKVIGKIIKDPSILSTLYDQEICSKNAINAQQKVKKNYIDNLILKVDCDKPDQRKRFISTLQSGFYTEEQLGGNRKKKTFKKKTFKKKSFKKKNLKKKSFKKKLLKNTFKKKSFKIRNKKNV